MANHLSGTEHHLTAADHHEQAAHHDSHLSIMPKKTMRTRPIKRLSRSDMEPAAGHAYETNIFYIEHYDDSPSPIPLNEIDLIQ
jgi:hypothetical protein